MSSPAPESPAPIGDWWPHMLRWHSDDPAVIDGKVHLALIEDHEEQFKYRHVYAALGDPDRALALLGTNGFKGHDVDTNGPRPSAGIGEYEPRFWVFTDGMDTFEPLAVRWTGGTHNVVLPDQGFLMTYGLAPRHTDDQVVHWDELSRPTRDIVTVKPTTSNQFGEHGTAYVVANSDIVQDYCSIRGLSVVQVFYVESVGDPDEEIRARLGDAGYVELNGSGRTLVLKLLDSGKVLAHCTGLRAVFTPSELPITEGESDYGTLDWPGIGLVTRGPGDFREPTHEMGSVFVSDAVLGRFEGQEGISIHPESGSVSYQSMWGVGYSHRYGRDLISVELVKLYEGTDPDIVRHYHDHAVDPPPITNEGWHTPNVAVRSKRIAATWAQLGVVLADLASKLGMALSPESIVGVDGADLDYRGWWSDTSFELISRHIAPLLNRDEFLKRCSDIYSATGDRLSERQLRRIAIALGFEPSDIERFRSLKLLGRIVAIANGAATTGLSLIDQSEEIVRRSGLDPDVLAVERLRSLNDLRQVGSHATSDGDPRFESALRSIGADTLDAVGDFNDALDIVYDAIGESIEAIRFALA